MRRRLTSLAAVRRTFLRLPVAALLLCFVPVLCARADEGPLGSLISTSREAEGLLRQGVTDERVQRVQQGVVDQLDALIAASRSDKTLAAGGTGKEQEPEMVKPGASTGPPQKPAEESILPPGEWRYGRMREPAEAGDTWMPELPAAERKKIADAFETGRLPRRYRELLRQYNKRLAEGGRAGGS